MGRTEQRDRFDQATRIALAERDLDAFDDELDGSEKRIKERIDLLDARLGKIMAACVAILTSLVVASVMLALNLAAGN